MNLEAGREPLLLPRYSVLRSSGRRAHLRFESYRPLQHTPSSQSPTADSRQHMARTASILQRATSFPYRTSTFVRQNWAQSTHSVRAIALWLS